MLREDMDGAWPSPFELVAEVAIGSARPWNKNREIAELNVPTELLNRGDLLRINGKTKDFKDIFGNLYDLQIGLLLKKSRLVH